ncbi:hypothetical protein HDF16_005597 [Granulicella aggregans]|uniref:Uncharacterized protein n=1 Tax=Granulicella aggregans TaxID=474949 RepID=A0A7W7ZJ42_9BACT|nr:hypothetical protein [Granulicella aggregans]MBB5060861.1 hypothetical protein [Granulicella aggregans]
MHDAIVADSPWSNDSGKRDDGHNAAEQPSATNASNFPKSCREKKGKQRKDGGIGECCDTEESAEAKPYRKAFLQMQSLGKRKAVCKEERGQGIVPYLSPGEVDCEWIDCPEPPGQPCRAFARDVLEAEINRDACECREYAVNGQDRECGLRRVDTEDTEDDRKESREEWRHKSGRSAHGQEWRAEAMPRSKAAGNPTHFGTELPMIMRRGCNPEKAKGNYNNA